MAKSIMDGKMLLVIFVGIIIAVTFTAQIATDTNRQTNLLPITNESLDISSARTGAGNDSVVQTIVLNIFYNKNITSNTPISNFVLRNNNTGLVIAAANYTLDATFGNLTLVDNSYWNGTTAGLGGVSNFTLASYEYKATDYVDDNASRGVIPLILIFAALAIVFFIIVSLMKPGTSMSELLRMR